MIVLSIDPGSLLLGVGLGALLSLFVAVGLGLRAAARQQRGQTPTADKKRK
jgi:hypothetical protein